MAEPATSKLSNLELSALLTEFAAAPGNFLVRLGEPKALFSKIETVASWAVGRTPPELSEQADELRDAAVMFVLRACFAAENTHYQVMAMSPKALTPEALRTRYRALIRLTHPDMGVQGLPANAAGIVNRANEVLGDPDLRSRYDDFLASRKFLARDELGAASVPQIELRASWRERWQSLVARFPTAVWAVPGTIGAIVASMGLLIWASTSTNDSRMLIVARGDDAPPEEDAPRSKPKGDKPEQTPKMPRNTSGQPWPAPGVMDRLAKSAAASTGTSGSTIKAPSAPPALLANADTSPQRAPAVADDGRQTTSTGTVDSARGAPPSQGRARQVTASRAEQEPAPAPPTVATSPPPTRAPAPASFPAPSAVAAATTTATSIAAAAPPPAPKPAAAPAETWGVDARQAQTYLSDLIMSLERPSRARRNNAYLAEMNVKGSLLQPALQLMRRFPEVAVEQMNWNDSQRPGAMNLQGMVTVRARNPDTGEAKQVNFKLSAEFWGTREGTVMAALSLREDD